MNIYINQNYCVYITHYLGDLLPNNYIGSTTIKKIENGYRGSVKSKKYKIIWEKELTENPQLFQTQIISIHYTRTEALEKELRLQKLLNVVKSSSFVNQSYASPNGFFGMNVSGENNPNYDNKWSSEQKSNLSKLKKDKEYIKNVKQNNFIKYGIEIYNNREKSKITCLEKYGVVNVSKNDQVKEQKRQSMLERFGVDNAFKIKATCPWCNKTGGYASLKARHFDKCPKNPNFKPEILICPHCNKQGTDRPNMLKYHFDRCRSKDIISS